MPSFTITRARLRSTFGSAPVGADLVDVTIRQGIIAAVSPAQGHGDGDVDADGAEVLPGLWDCHAHFSLAAVIHQCLRLSPEYSQAQVYDAIRGHDGDQLLLGYGFRAATWLTPPTAASLDAVREDQPVALISRDLHSVWCNSLGLQLIGAADHPTGYLVEEEAFAAIRALMVGNPVLVEAAVAAMERQAAALGLVGIVDFSSGWAVQAWQERAKTRRLGMRVEAATYPEHLDDLIALGAPTGTELTQDLRVGPLKIIADGSMGSRTAFCSLPYPQPLPGHPHGILNYSPADLAELLGRARSAGLQAAVHAIGDAGCRVVLDAFEATGAIGSIEHAQCVATSDLARFGKLGLTASIQPLHQVDDASVVGEVWPQLQHQAYPMRDLLHAGTQIVLGSDAPVALLDPWRTISAACDHPFRASQALTWEEAVLASTRSRIAPGQPADLILIDDRSQVQFTVVGGRVTYMG
ncbi:MAG: amidohydrolase family protein [Propionibacteriaceae bacterium]|nr:amidohydrolase family protein [Propionibacteriaceae bacterium]